MNNHRTLAILLSGTALVGTPALAQEASDQGSGSGFDEIVVSARKRDESLLDVPVAISALSADALTDRGIRGFNELNDFVPGMRYENSSTNRNDRGFTTVTMRGMFPGDSANRQAVSVFIDGVAAPGGAVPGLSDVERVEVVKGPQSAYFGRSTFAGAINFITAAPSLTEIKGKIDLSYATYNQIDASTTIEGPLIADRLAVRLSGRFYKADGQYDNEGYSGRLGDRETRSVAFSVIAKPTDTLTLRSFFSYWEDSDGPSAQGALTENYYNCNPGGTARQVRGLNYTCGGIGSVPRATMSQNTSPNGQSRFDVITGGPAATVLSDDFIDHMGLERRAYIGNLLADWAIGDYTLAGSFSHAQNRWAALTDTYNRAPDGTGYYSTVYVPNDQENTSAEIRLSSPVDRPFSWLIGANYYHEDIRFQTLAYRANAISQLSRDTDYVARTFGVFGSATYDFGGGFSLVGEGRFQWDTIDTTVNNVGGFQRKATFDSFSPRVILNYAAAPTINFYASYAKGTRPGTFNNGFFALPAAAQAQVNAQVGDVPVDVAEEKLTSYEAGVKGDMFDRRLRVLASVYYSEWRDRQVTSNIAYTIGATTSTSGIIFSSGSVNLYGLELETAFKITPQLTLEGTFNWAGTSIRSTSCLECVAINGVANPVDNTMERYPEFSGTAALSYERPISAAWNGFARLDYIYTGKQYATAANISYTDAANRFNLSLGISNDDFRIEVFGRNIFDNKVPTNILRYTNPNSNAAQGLNLIVVAPPERATFGVRTIAHF
jgi:iron complex outermembrane receptor protein